MRQVAEFPAEDVFSPVLPRLRTGGAARPFLVVLALLAVGYFASPYVVLYRLSRSVRAGDFVALTAAIDWPKMQSAIHQTIENAIAGETVSKPNDDDLPPFGSGFLTGMADRVVSKQVTPDRLAATLAAFETAGPAKAPSPSVTVSDARFAGLSRFVVSLHFPGAAAGEAPLRIVLRFLRGRWRIVDAEMPPSLLAAIEARAS